MCADDLIFRRPQGGRVVIAPQAAEVFTAQRQLQAGDREAGGMLLGRFFADSSDILVDEATRPSQKDRQRRFAFWRGKRAAQKIVDSAWGASCGTRNYLGEWHTHPEPYPTPSEQDLCNWARITKKARYEQSSLLFVVVGTEEVRLWELSRDIPPARLDRA